MLPNILIGSITISTYWIMLGIGSIGMFIYLLQRRFRFTLSFFQCTLFVLLLTIIGFAGAKLLFILENLGDTFKNGISLGGVSFFGSVFLIPLLMPGVGRLFRLNHNQTMDICGPCVTIMIGCMRIGCFLQGCCGGWETCVGSFYFAWPTQAIESVIDFIILGILINREENKKFHGILYPMFMVFYSIVRFFIEFLRETPKDWFYLSHGQWFSLISLIIGIMWIMRRRQKAC